MILSIVFGKDQASLMPVKAYVYAATQAWCVQMFDMHSELVNVVN